MKKIFLLIVLLVSFLTTIFALENNDLGELTKAKVDEFCTITGITREDLEEFVIPDGYTAIGDSAFAECKNLKKVTIPNSVTVIGEWAFHKCKNLSNVNIPTGTIAIGDDAFANTGLKNIVIPSTVNTIGKQAFAKCSELLKGYVVIEVGNPPSLGREAFFIYGGAKVKILVPPESVYIYKTDWKEDEYSDFIIEPITDELLEKVSGAEVLTKSAPVSNKQDDSFSFWDFLGILIGLGLPILIIVLIVRGIRNAIRNAKKRKMELEEKLNYLETKGLPTINDCSLVLSDEEVCHYYEEAKFLKVKERVVGYTSGANGVSFRIAKGVSYHTGGGKRHAIREDVLEESSGVLTITNKRIVGTSLKWSFDKKIDSLTSVEYGSRYVILQFGSQQFLIQPKEIIYFSKLLKLLLKKSE